MADSKKSAPIHVSIERHALLRPDAIAVTCDGSAITYAELNRRANQIAHRLLGMGVMPDSLVAIAMDRSIEMIVGLLGILKSGAGYLPVDHTYPSDRIEFILKDAAPVAVLSTSAHFAAIAKSGVPSVLLDTDESLRAQNEHNPSLEIDPQSLIYVIYTSGSTGKPKGCQLTHANVARLFTSTQHWFGFGPDDVWTFFHSHAFDFSVWEIWGALIHGGRVAVVPYLVSRSPQDFHKLLISEGVTVLNQTPSAFRTLIEADRNSGAPADALKLRYVIFGGEALELQMLKPWFDRHGDAKPQLVNMYGITETTVHVTYRPIALADLEARRGSVIGQAIPDLEVHVLDDKLVPVPTGTVGEMFVGGAGVCRGYLNRPELNAQRFIDWQAPGTSAAQRLYRSGDLARWLPDGDLEYLGRIDHQVKIRGFRIETGEIESVLVRHPAVKSCAVIARRDNGGEARLVAYVVARDKGLSQSALREHLAADLPDYMIPSAFVQMNDLPMTENGKLDRKALPEPGRERPALGVPFERPRSALESKIAVIFAELLGIDEVGRLDGFFELGGSSLDAVQAVERIAQMSGAELSAPTIFARPTIAELAASVEDLLRGSGEQAVAADIGARHAALNEPIAVIGMAGRFPGASSVEQFCTNLFEGRDSLTRFDDASLDASVSSSLRNDPAYIRARGVIEDVEMFDASFFSVPPREAEVTDPQQRVFLELAWECIERAGYAPDRTPGAVAVFAGMGAPTYLQHNVLKHPKAIERVGELQVQLANDKDYIATRVAYKFNLKGPAVNINTACSTSLVAVAQAVDSLRLGRCSMALAGAASVTSPPRSGYLYQEGSMLSNDGHTRTFDSKAQGTTFNDGATVVLLKRLSDALADGDTVHAVIRGAATNNDGGGKASFTAPSVDGQADVIAAAHRDADIDPRSISYVEAHGTATPLGDPVEVEGLTRAFRRRTDDVGFCRIGSVKSNVGHLVTAAGVAGLIKVALSFKNETLPATLHYESPNPKIDFARSPFVVNAQPSPWPRAQAPRRAGVSSFGVGGTNAHVVLEEPPAITASAPAVGAQLLMLSAKSASALSSMASRLADHLDAAPDTNLADVAHTLQAGRSRFAHRMSVVGVEVAQAVKALRSTDDPMRAVKALGASIPSMVWLFPGQGAQYAGMGRGLYETNEVFRTAFDECIDAMRGVLDFDLKERMFGGKPESLVATGTTQPATFCLEYALAKTWLSLGAQPVALIGHSVGEFAAAVIAGVMSLADAARLVAKRGAMMQALPAGSMLSVRMSYDKLLALLPSGLSIAAENGPTACVVAGPTPEVESLQAKLEAEGVVSRMLQTSHAFHSAMMDPAVAPFEAEVRKVALAAPRIPIVSTLTGNWMSAAEATDVRYWARHLREAVRFSPAVRTALAKEDSAFVEIGPRGTLAALARQHIPPGKGTSMAVASLGDVPESESALLTLARGQLWNIGIELNAPAASPAQGRHRIQLPSYPFERKRFWLDSIGEAAAQPEVTPEIRPIQQTVANAAPAVQAAPIQSIQAPTTMSTSMPAAVSRRPQLVVRLRELFEDVAGADLGQTDTATSFVELGLDSLTLTQAALQVKKGFGVAVTFRQLMETYRSFDSLAEFLDSKLPAEAAQPAAAPVVAQAAAQPAAQVVAQPVVQMAARMNPVEFVPMNMTAPAPGVPMMQSLIQQQMQLMAQQLALLSGVGVQAAMSVQQPVATVAAQPQAEPVLQNVPAQAAAAAAKPASSAAAGAVADEGGRINYDVKKAFGAIARIHTQATDITERQRARLQAFMRRYVDRTKRSKEYAVQHRPHLADPRVVNGFRPMTKEIVYQIVVDKTKGSRMWDIDGNEYIDVLNGFGMNLFGWQPDFVQDAVRKQLDLGYEIGPMHPLAGEVAQLVCELTGHDRAGLCNTGSEAVMAAIRIARTVTGRDTVVLFTGSYHGTFDEVLVRAGRGGKGIPAAPGIMAGAFGDVRVLDYGTPEALEFIRKNADDLAAVLVEPVQSRRPDFQPREFLKEVRAITERSGTCFIFDEVITGFRAHLGGTQTMFGIKADLACYGKVIGGGYPVGVVAGKREYMDSLDGGAWQYGDDSIPSVGVTYFAGTFVRHPLALAAAKASLLHFKQQGNSLQTKLNTTTAAMADELTAYCREVGAPLEIRHFSSLWRVTWLEDHPLQDLLFAMMRSRGVHILDNFPCFMTTAHTPEDVAKIKTAFKESIAELQEAEFLPRKEQSAVLADASKPPVPNAKLGRDKDGRPAWFVPDANAPGKFVKVDA